MVGALQVHVAFHSPVDTGWLRFAGMKRYAGHVGEVPNDFGSADTSLVKVDVMCETVAPKVQET